MKRRVRRQQSQSKQFEELAARLESALSPKGAIVKSPDRLRDQFTGQYREVDASIRYSIGSSDMLITIECRDRVRTQDVTWIEQLATKRLHVKADRTLAVSSSPFTEAALRAAKTHGISTRLISEVTDEDLRAQVNTLLVTVHSTDISVRQLQLHYVEHIDPPPGLAPDALHDWDHLAWEAPIFRIGGSTNSASLDDLIKIAAQSAKPESIAAVPAAGHVHARKIKGTDLLVPHLADIPSDGATVERQLALTFGDDAVFVNTNVGWRQLQAVGLILAVTRSTKEVPPSRIGAYSTEDRLVTHFAEHELEWKPGETWRVLSYPTSTAPKGEA